MSRIRKFTREDLAAVAALFHKIYLASDPAQANTPIQHVRDSFNEIFLCHPWRDEDMHSLVCEGRDGELQGFIGVTPRRMMINGRQLLAAVSAHLMLEPDRQTGFAGIRLLQQFLSGPQ